ncbi:MAG TPA: M23 family metallopeptidase [Syntrophaceticus sp.]|nr:M23 family metallopeptidase [Syntrophaceticus sp.]
MDTKEKEKKVFISSRQLTDCREFVCASLHKLGPWWIERFNWIKSDLGKGKDAFCRLLDNLRAGQWKPGRNFWKSPYLITAVITGMVVVGSNLYLQKNQLACAAYYNGQRIAVLASQQEAEKVLACFEQELEETIGQDVFLNESVQFKMCMVPRSEVKSADYYETILRQLPWTADGVELCVDDQPILVLASQEIGEELLERYQNAVIPDESKETIESVRFEGKITFRNKQVAVKEIVPLKDALQLLMGGGLKEKTYIVQEGDTLWDIAAKHNLQVDELLLANAHLTAENLKPGQEIKLTAVEPLLKVVITSHLVTKELLPYETKTKYDSNLDSGKTKVVQEGKNGEARVVYRIVRENSRIVKKLEIERTVVKEPEAKVVAKGTRTMLASRGTGGGTLRWPVGGVITSRYGYRGREFHSGLDIGANYGAAVGAAAAGRVTSAGWQGNYGYMVTIDHGGGLVTRYAHLSQINVSVGQSVSSGQIIGRVGTTGRATGPHLHFEVLANGSHRNPLNYLR